MQSITDYTNIALIICNVAVFWACAVVFIFKLKTYELKSQKRFFLGLALFFIFWGLMKICFTISNYYKNIDLIYYSIYWKIAASLGICGLLSIILVLETYMVKSKYFFSIITLIGLVLAMTLPISGTEITGARLASYIFLPLGAISIILLYLYLYVKLTGKLRHETGLILWGILLIFLGYSVNIELIKKYFDPILLDHISSIMMICGALLYTLMYYRKKA
ncbi:MAG: hypothetical protein ACTSRP_00095 [Candidatus Helarchaeota archaeon]